VSGTDDDSLSSHPSSRLDGLNSVGSPEIDFRPPLGRGFTNPAHRLHTEDLLNRFSNIHPGTEVAAAALEQETRYRLDQQRSVMHAEIGSIKSKYLRKMTDLERMLDNLKNEKREL
jgi:hypothetical protein